MFPVLHFFFSFFFSLSTELLSCTETAQGTLCTPQKRPCESGTALLLLPVFVQNCTLDSDTCNLLFFQLQGWRARRHRRNGHGGTLRRGRRLARSLAQDPSRKTAGAAIAAKPNWSWYSRNWAPVAAVSTAWERQTHLPLVFMSPNCDFSHFNIVLLLSFFIS